MTSQYEMRFPFTSQKEILDWEAYYINDLSEKSQSKEQTVIDLKKEVKGRVKLDTPKGYLCKTELLQMAQWKSHYTPSKVDKNPSGVIEDVTGEAFSIDDDWEKLQKLSNELTGVRESVASVILHLYDPKKYPILDVHALNSIGIDNSQIYYDEPFWREYVDLCRAEAERYDVSMRTLDRALYKYSQSGTVSALKIISDESLILELKRRGNKFKPR